MDNAGLGSDVLDGVIIKPFFKNPKVAQYLDLLEGLRKNLLDIPPTQIKYDTWDVAPFTLNRPIVRGEFTDKDTAIAWDWSHGQTAKQLGLHSMQLNRILERITRTLLEKEYHGSQPSVGVNSQDSNVTD